ncbi:MAG: altronate dehydratase [Clostridia bacterium]|nr:altronate dehydratase [Clostridia bacterium]
MSFLLKINEKDNVAVAIGELKKGAEVKAGDDIILLIQDIPKAHKAAIADIKSGENVVKYGYPIGHAVCDIKKGEHVHSHNIKTNLGDIEKYAYNPLKADYTVETNMSFAGYKRHNGKVGVRNEIWIIPTVGCINGIAKTLENMSREKEGVDGVFAFTHPFGCSQLGDDLKNTQKILAGLVNHPNAGGVLVLGLGCENNLIADFKKVIGEIDDNRVKFLECQKVDDEIADGLELIEELIVHASKAKREIIPASELIVGLKCGGSDGYSGITANPMVGAFSDILIRQGGTTILTEVPEMFGAETLLMERCRTEEAFESTVALINSFKDYYKSHGQPIYENPSPGNKDGGITTLEEKSLGCTTKSGTMAVEGVYGYGETIDRKGLMLLSAPGNDLVATTALIASGAQIVLFTTGRGTPFGGPVPTVKISTNNELFNKKKSWIDFNAGDIAEGRSINESTGKLAEYTMKLASGEIKTKNEEHGIREISIFKDGVFL